MKKILIFIFSIGLLFACTDKFEDYNTKKNIVYKLPPQIFLVSMIPNIIDPYEYENTTEFYDVEYAQYIANMDPNENHEVSRYLYTPPNNKWDNEFPDAFWVNCYTKALKQYYGLADACEGVDYYKNIRGAGEVMVCYMFLKLADKYGAIPYIGASKGVLVKYNKEEMIYPDLLKRLDYAANLINPDDITQIVPNKEDIIYNGDFKKWKKFANSMMLRIAMRISKVAPQTAQLYAEKAVAGGCFDNVADVAEMPMDPQHPGRDSYYYMNLSLTWNYYSPSKIFCDKLREASNVLDPRASKWLTPSLIGGQYVGAPNGRPLTDSSAYGYDIGTYMKKFASRAFFNKTWKNFIKSGSTNPYPTVPIMNYAEVLFLQAEGKLRGWNTGASVEDLYKAGIKASVKECGGADADADTYIAGLKNAVTGDKESVLKEIITQKWIAMFPNGSEGWAEFRRTGYPITKEYYPDVNGSSTVCKGNWITRVRYINAEHNDNSGSIPEGYKTLVDDRQDKAIWWGQKDASGVFPITLTPSNF